MYRNNVSRLGQQCGQLL